MAYILDKQNRSRGIYLRLYFGFRDPDTKRPTRKFIKTLGYVCDLENQGIKDPLSYYENKVKEMNSDLKYSREEEKTAQIQDISLTRHLGYFPLLALIKKLDVENDFRTLASTRKFHFDLFRCMCSLIFARAVDPCSKKQTVDKVLPTLWGNYDFSYDDVLNCLGFIGSHYEKIVEIFTLHTDETYILDTENVLFDCTNYYFEIDKEDEWRRKGPSKENRKDPIIGMGLLLDANVIPIGMKMYPGNESEQPVLREIINELKQQGNIKGRTIQIADKGLNSARNIHSAVLAGDGYIFSKSVKKLPAKERKWVLADRDWTVYCDEKGDIKFKLKECVDEFSYTYYNEIETENGKKKKSKVTFKVKEKRIVSYNPKLAKKQRLEIDKLANKARTGCLSQLKKSEFGECGKYVSFMSQDENGNISDDKAIPYVNQDAIDRDKEVCGYNMIITSEIKMPAKSVYDKYHELTHIEESFKCIKSEVEARPVYLQKTERIFGHFLICYLSVLLERLFQFKILENNFGSHQVYEFIRDFNVAIGENGKFSNVSVRSKLIEFLAKKYNLPILHLFLKGAQINKVLERVL